MKNKILNKLYSKSFKRLPKVISIILCFLFSHKSSENSNNHISSLEMIDFYNHILAPFNNNNYWQFFNKCLNLFHFHIKLIIPKLVLPKLGHHNTQIRIKQLLFKRTCLKRQMNHFRYLVNIALVHQLDHIGQNVQKQLFWLGGLRIDILDWK